MNVVVFSFGLLQIPDRRSKVVVAENLPELFPPSKQPPSPIWEHFGLPKNAEGVVEEDGPPVCRICGKKVSSQDGRKMIRHLHFCHFSVYEEFKVTSVLQVMFITLFINH